jgi:glycine/D-amino acid oxidase-like deaminating enzyme
LDNLLKTLIFTIVFHQHAGWTLGGISGKLIAQEVSANKTDIDLKSFPPERF